MPNFPFSAIASQRKLMWFNFNTDRDIASLIWVPSQRQANWMHHELFAMFSEDSTLTDMTALRRLSLNAQEQIDYFPSSPYKSIPEDAKPYLETISKHGQEKMTDYGIFDGAAIGMWIAGEDPNNHRGILRRLRHLSDGPIDLRARRFKMIESNLYLVDENSLIPIYNLHVHSKNKYLFTRHGTQILRFYVSLSNWKIGYPIFLPFTFARLVYNKIKNPGK
jgi:hypothetical protein